MNYTQISQILNDAVIKNELGEAVTIEENLSNIVEVGKSIANMTSDDLKDFQNKIAVGIYRNYVQNRLYKTKDFKILKDAVAFGGGIQRIMNKDLASAVDSHILNLVDGVNYFDGTYHGFDVDAKLYLDTKAFKVVWSLGNETWNMSFTTAEGVSQLFGLIEARIENTMTAQIHALEKRVLAKLIVDAYRGNRKIQLVTLYNQTMGYENAKTYTQIKADNEEFRKFNAWSNSIVARLVDYVKELNEKYNDGTVLTFTPRDKVNVLMLTQFASESRFLGLYDAHSPQYAQNDIPFDTVSAWQNQSELIMPDYGVTAAIKDETGTVENVVGVVYDTDAAGITTKLDKVTAQYIGSEDYTNFYHHVAMNYYEDTRNAAIVLVLE